MEGAKHQNLILIGMPSAGKSTLGVLVAKSLGMDFLDTDILIQTQQGERLQTLIDRFGLDRFLEMEAQAVLSLDVRRTVIATGGSVVYSEPAMRHLHTLGLVAYLSVPLQELVRRLGDTATRGIARREGQTLADLYGEREPLYRRHAELSLDWLENDSLKVMADRLLELAWTRLG